MAASGDYAIVRTYSAGVFSGTIKELDLAQRVVVLSDARRLWRWRGAASLSQLAQSGTSDPRGCQFPEPVTEVTLLEVIEILAVTAAARASIGEVPTWRK